MSELATIHAGNTEVTLPILKDGVAGGGFAFGVYKGGSTMLFRSLHRLTQNSDVSYVDLVNLFHKEGVLLETAQFDEANITKIEDWLRRAGTIFGGWREYPLNYRLPLGTDTATYLLVRDPRDCVTSQYYSLKYSHTLAGASGDIVLRARAQLQNTEIDEFVLPLARRLAVRFGAYSKLDNTKLMLRRYEDVIFEKEKMLSEICEHLRIDVPRTWVKRVADEIDKRPPGENVNAHVRQVTPGDHRKKLKPQTIEALNASLAPILSKYGYS